MVDRRGNERAVAAGLKLLETKSQRDIYIIILIIYFQSRGGYKQVHLDEGSPQPAQPPLDHPHGTMAAPASPTGIKE